ncbi:hypothetical protein A3A70_02070 [candidate division WWE3 bacterium RIFCSPLOWO2_01_FULL_42_11]|uniref:Uncharacterized protein n=1 Tax=candidate division WWE3 bacterium RIFCSPLOWO2_01_FULL_42_11 TaxID=1802627 RepID=A0A1F4VRA4_UNCKA|nr:MAG: hypothetical protein A3A70_02070 [candidate division WWE3 bacterium RIFCSPLOWO2_01_FULL_42_11]
MSKTQLWIIANGTIAITGAIIFWFLLNQFFSKSFNIIGLERDLLKIVIWLSLALSFITIPYALLAITKASKRVTAVISTLAAATGVAFIHPIWPVFPLMLVGTITTNYMFVRSVENGLVNQLKFKPYGVISVASGRFLTLMAIWVSVGSYFFASAQPPVAKVEIPENVINNMIDLISKNQAPGKSEATALKAYEASKLDLIKQLKEDGITDEETINTYTKEAESKYLEIIRNQNSQVSLPQNSLIKNEIKGEVEGILNDILTKYRKFVPIIYSVSIFALFSLVGRLLEVIGLFFTHLIFSSLFGLKIIKLKQVESIKEELVLG